MRRNPDMVRVIQDPRNSEGPPMTREHFEELAALLRSQRFALANDGAYTRLVNAMAAWYAAKSRSFDQVRFIQRCWGCE